MLEKEKIKELISGFSRQYNLNKDLDDHLMSMVDSYNYVVKVERGDSIVFSDQPESKKTKSVKSLERIFAPKNNRPSDDVKPFEVEDITNIEEFKTSAQEEFTDQNIEKIITIDNLEIKKEFGFDKDNDYIMIEKDKMTGDKNIENDGKEKHIEIVLDENDYSDRENEQDKIV
jgi:hypothetical protein